MSQIRPINPETDCLYISCLQNDFLSLGNLPIPGADEIVSPIVTLLPFFAFENIFFSLHSHSLDYFRQKNAYSERHAVVNSTGQDLPLLITQYVYKQCESGKASPYNILKYQCSLLGDRNSVFLIKFDNGPNVEQMLLKAGVRRIIFVGLHLEPCISIDAFHFLSKKLCRVVILENLIRLTPEEQKNDVRERLTKAGAQFVESPLILPK